MHAAAREKRAFIRSSNRIIWKCNERKPIRQRSGNAVNLKLTALREREGVDLTKIQLTHYKLKDEGKRNLPLQEGESAPLKPITASGSGAVQAKEKVFLNEIIELVNQLFEGELTDDDKLVYVHVLKTKLSESEILREQAVNNTKEQFANSSHLTKGIEDAIISALNAHSSMSRQAINSEKLRLGLKDILLGPAQLYETLRTTEKQNKQSNI